MSDLEGNVAFITGAGRGQGRSHAIQLARAGCNIVATDICGPVASVDVPMAGRADLEETARLVREAGGEVMTRIADVRDQGALGQAADDGMAEFGRLDIVLANAGIWAVAVDEPRDPERRVAVWKDTIDINLTGVWNTLEVTAPHLITGCRGGSIVITSSTQGLKAAANDDVSLTAYVAAKHGVIGLMRNFAVDLAPHWVRVNAIAPSGVNTLMSQHEIVAEYGAKHPQLGEMMRNLLDVGVFDPSEISRIVEFLVSDAARYITGIVLPVDAGHLVK